jgi:hypothetical protein
MPRLSRIPPHSAAAQRAVSVKLRADFKKRRVGTRRYAEKLKFKQKGLAQEDISKTAAQRIAAAPYTRWDDLIPVARVQNRENHQIRQAEQQLLRLFACDFGGAAQKPQMMAARHIPQEIELNPDQVGDFFFGKEFLACFHSHHVRFSVFRPNHDAIFALR